MISLYLGEINDHYIDLVTLLQDDLYKVLSTIFCKFFFINR